MGLKRSNSFIDLASVKNGDFCLDLKRSNSCDDISSISSVASSTGLSRAMCKLTTTNTSEGGIKAGVIVGMEVSLANDEATAIGIEDLSNEGESMCKGSSALTVKKLIDEIPSISSPDGAIIRYDAESNTLHIYHGDEEITMDL